MATQFKYIDYPAAQATSRAPAAGLAAVNQAFGNMPERTLDEVADQLQQLDLAAWDRALAKAEAAIAARDDFDAAHLEALAAAHASTGLQPWDAANDGAWETLAQLRKEATRATRNLAELTPPNERGLILVMRLLCDTEALDGSGAGGEAIEAIGRHVAEVLDGAVPRNRFMSGPQALWERRYAALQERDAEYKRFWAQVYAPSNDLTKAARRRLAEGNPSETDQADYERLIEIEREHMRLADGYSDARRQLYLAPAPGPAELAVKLKLIQAEEDWEWTEFAHIMERITTDARRFGRLGPFLQTDAPLLDAYSHCRRKDAEWLGTEPKAREYDAAGEREYEQLEDQIYATSAKTVEGVIARLRVAFKGLGEYGFTDHALLDPRHPAFAEGLKGAGGNLQLLWGAIEDLARMGGIDLAEGVEPIAVGSPPAQPATSAGSHRELLAERTQLREREGALLAADTLSDEEFDLIGSQLNRIDGAIQRLPARSSDDAVTKLLLVAQLVIEGNEPDPALAADAVAAARRFGLDEANPSPRPDASGEVLA